MDDFAYFVIYCLEPKRGLTLRGLLYTHIEALTLDKIIEYGQDMGLTYDCENPTKIFEEAD